MKRLLRFLFLILSLTACKNAAFYTDMYTRVGKKSTFLQKQYELTDSLEVKEIRICLQPEIPTRYYTSGEIIFRRDSLGASLQRAITRHFKPIYNQSQWKQFWESNCESFTAKKHRVLERKPQDRQNQKHSLVAVLNISSLTSKRIEGGGGISWPEDMGDDIHRLKYKLIVAIFQNETLLYMDSRTHWTEVISERGTQLKYQVPQVTIDSLTSLSLRECFKRAK